MGLLRRFLISLSLIVLLLPAAIYLRERLLVDRCLDRGGGFDYVAGECRFDRSPPYVPFLSRYGVFVVACVAASLLSLGVAVFGLRRPSNR